MRSVRQFLQPRWLVGHVLVAAALLVCLRLAWWQFDRSEEADGTLQNVGYAVLWPAFGVAFVYMWIRFLVLERRRDEADTAAEDDAVTRMLAEADEITAAAAPLPAATPEPAAALPATQLLDVT